MAKHLPCQNCPFRKDIVFWLSSEKVQKILKALFSDGDFPCHDTIPATDKPHRQSKGCIGAAIFLEHVREEGLRANRSFRMREGYLKEFHRSELDMDASVFSGVDAFIAAKTNGNESATLPDN